MVESHISHIMNVIPSIYPSLQGLSPSFIQVMMTWWAHASPNPLYSPSWPPIPPTIHCTYIHKTRQTAESNQSETEKQKDWAKHSAAGIVCVFTLPHRAQTAVTKRNKSCTETRIQTLVYTEGEICKQRQRRPAKKNGKISPYPSFYF